MLDIKEKLSSNNKKCKRIGRVTKEQTSATTDEEILSKLPSLVFWMLPNSVQK